MEVQLLSRLLNGKAQNLLKKANKSHVASKLKAPIKTESLIGTINLERPDSRVLRINDELAEKQSTAEIEKIMLGEYHHFKTVLKTLENLSDSTGMPIVQENGQRSFGPPRNSCDAEPEKSSEIFVGKLPRELYESTLVPLFSKIGPIYTMRLMMDFCKLNRGYCFVQYFRKEDADRAIKEFDEYQILPGRKIGVLKSVDNCRLVIGCLPKDKSRKQILIEMQNITDGVKDVIIYPGLEANQRNRGYAFVDYSCHRSAAMARRKLIPGKNTLWGKEVSVDWASPEPEVRTIYVRNISTKMGTRALEDMFNKVAWNGVEHIKRLNTFAFITFATKEQADAARIAMDNQEIGGSVIEVKWAKADFGPEAKAFASSNRTSKIRSTGLPPTNRTVSAGSFDSNRAGTPTKNFYTHHIQSKSAMSMCRGEKFAFGGPKLSGNPGQLNLSSDFPSSQAVLQLNALLAHHDWNRDVGKSSEFDFYKCGVGSSSGEGRCDMVPQKGFNTRMPENYFQDSSMSAGLSSFEFLFK